jgi:nucleoid-associated protein YgaU
MTVPVDAQDASEQRPAAGLDTPQDAGPRPRSAPSAREVVAGICPYLTSSGGSWRVVTPSREHRCAAVDPPAPQPTDKQRRHCLSKDHVSCAVFLAAREARSGALAAGANPALVEAADRRRRPLARTAPVLLEPPRLVDQAVRLQFERGPGQLALIGLMIVAFAIVALTRLSAGGAASASPAPSHGAAAPSPSPRPTPTATPSVGPSPSSGSPAPSAQATYTVRKGDTLLSIAKKFNTTAAKIKTLNGLKGSALKVGQILKIP